MALLVLIDAACADMAFRAAFAMAGAATRRRRIFPELRKSRQPDFGELRLFGGKSHKTTGSRPCWIMVGKDTGLKSMA
jgi:hypothetical protein